jgi:hypothetical protein
LFPSVEFAWFAVLSFRPNFAVDNPDSSKLAEQNQDQNDNEYKAEAAATVVAGPVEGTPPNPLKPPSSAITKMMSRMVPIDMTLSRWLGRETSFALDIRGNARPPESRLVRMYRCAAHVMSVQN